MTGVQTCALPICSGADWTAATKEDFESSIQALGDSLVAGLGAGGQRAVREVRRWGRN